MHSFLLTPPSLAEFLDPHFCTVAYISYLLLRLWSYLTLQYISDVNLLTWMIPLPLLKRVTTGHGNLRPIVIECQARNGRGTFGNTAQLLFIVGVPCYDSTVGPPGGECPVCGMESNGVDGVDCVVDTVTFEGILFLVCIVIFVTTLYIV